MYPDSTKIGALPAFHYIGKRSLLYRRSVISIDWLIRLKKESTDVIESEGRINTISTHLLARSGWFCPVVSEPVKPYFTRFFRVLTFCLGASKIVILKENGVVNI